MLILVEGRVNILATALIYVHIKRISCSVSITRSKHREIKNEIEKTEGFACTVTFYGRNFLVRAVFFFNFLIKYRSIEKAETYFLLVRLLFPQGPQGKSENRIKPFSFDISF